jgi:hypothetical protein
MKVENDDTTKLGNQYENLLKMYIYYIYIYIYIIKKTNQQLSVVGPHLHLIEN